ncbi:MAG: hypothetical protein PHH49_08400 [Candidatus Omnitrophica bacterium]|nr:hypothetical protein [Candidatus Omnitrophota bacterium]MDD5488958.1 hypothetical protein [Candidatus Omnitrophota bacterium]
MFRSLAIMILFKYRTDNRGTTLVEVLVGFMLAAIIVLSIIAISSQSSVFAKRIDTVYIATQLAQDRLNVLKRMDFAFLPISGETNIRVDASGNVDPQGRYTRTTEITENYDNISSLTKVTVTVKRINIGISGTTASTLEYMGDPIVVETLFSDVS